MNATIRTSSVTQLLDTFNACERAVTDIAVPLPVFFELLRMYDEDAENVHTRAMMHAEDIRRTDLVQEMWESQPDWILA
jgi:hypothetical protein